MALNIMIRIGYFLLFLTLGLMIWVSLSSAKETDNMKFPPCPFNTLCSCSKAAPDLGIVQCRSVPFPAIPESINNSKVFMLHMESTGLRIIEPYFLYATGLYRLEISYNPLTDIPDDAFAGLERTLWELMLQHNHLIDIPSRALRHLQKLRHLDLSGNQISTIEPDSWRGLENSLQTLILSENSISHLPPDSFASLPLLETLDLSGNNLAEIDGSVFRDGMAKLSKLLLSDNLLIEIPFMELSPLKLLRTLDISYNRIQNLIINDMQNPPNINVKMTLDNLHLEYNIIDTLSPGSFQYFDIVNRTFFDGNPLKTISEDAFRQARIRELYLRHCTLNFISPAAFAGLENSLQILDLSGNNLTALPEKLFNDFDYLRNLNLRDNQITSIAPNEMFNGFQFTLFKLDLSGNKNGVSNLQELRRLRNIRSLAVGRLSSQNLVQDDFLEFGVELEDLKIVQASVKSIKSHAFMHVRGLKRLDLSENAITTIESDAFQEIGHSLISLKISHGLSSSLSKLPSEPLRHLSSLQELDITNNKIKTMVDTSFHFLKELRILELHDNQIEQIHKGTFQGDIHSKLEEISLSFNNIKTIVQHTFVDLENLERLHLDDNNIDNLERRAFMNLDALDYLSLRGNKISKISDETFQVSNS